MARREFPTSVKVAVIKRSTRDGVTYCEKCKAIAKRWQIDHVNPDGLTGKPVIENAMLICKPCYSVKNPADTRVIAQAKRREARHVGAVQPKAPIQSRGFPKKPRPEKIAAAGASNLMRRFPGWTP